MLPQDFSKPLNQEEFVKRAATYTIEGARNVIATLTHRRIAAVKSIDEEIKFLEKVIEYKEAKNK